MAATAPILPALQGGPSSAGAASDRSTDVAGRRDGLSRAAAVVGGSPARSSDPATSLAATSAATPATGASAVSANGAPAAAASLAAGTPAFGATGPGAAIQGGVIPGAAGPGATGPSTAASASPGTGNGLTPATPDALAASVIAMCRNGQPSLLLRLDPPGLGALSVHVAMGSNADVNVLFVPTVAQTAHLLHGGLGDLRQAMAASGLTLGQAQIGSGGGSNSTGGGGTDRDQARNPATAAASPFVAPPQPENAARGARAVA